MDGLEGLDKTKWERRRGKGAAYHAEWGFRLGNSMEKKGEQEGIGSR